MSNRHDIVTMDMGIDGWKIKTEAAEILVRHRRPDLPQNARISINEIVSNRHTDDVQIHFSAKRGFLIWANDLGAGTISVSVSEFNSFMNRHC